MKHAILLLAAAAILAGGCGGGVIAPSAELKATRGASPAVMVAKGPAVDGTVSDALWGKCPELVIAALEERDTLNASARIMLDAKNLYLAVVCDEADTDKLVAEAVDRDGAIWDDDNIEFFVEANPEVGRVHIAVNSKGVVVDGLTRSAGAYDPNWDSSVVVSTRIEKNKRWIVTLAIPLKDLGAVSGEGQTWRMNINRTKPLNGEHIEASWSATGSGDYHVISGWGKLTGVNIP